MKRFVTKIIACVLVCTMATLTASCGNKKEVKPQEQTTTQEESQKQTTLKAELKEQQTGEIDLARIWTDSLGREVVLPSEIKAVTVSGPLAQMAVEALAPDKMLEYDIQNQGQLYGVHEKINSEEILVSQPDVIIDMGEAKKGIEEDLDELQEQLNIPVIHIEMSLSTGGAAFEKLGDLLNMKEEAKEYSEYCDNIYQRAYELSEKITDKKKVLLITGENGLNVIAQGSPHAEVIDLLTDNLAVVEQPTAKGTGNEVDMEQILNWNPDYIFFVPGSIYETVGTDPNWQNVNAIKNGNYWEVPKEPYNWLGFPPSVQRYLGLLWVPSILYPEYVDYDADAEIAAFCEKFFHTNP